MSTATKALLLQKQEWLRANQDGSGEQAKDILATIVVKATLKQLTILRAVTAAFAKPIPIRQHLKGQSYLTRLAEEQLLQYEDAEADDANSAGHMNDEQENDSSEDGSHDGEEERHGDSISDSLTAACKTQRPARLDKKLGKTGTPKSKKRSRDRKGKGLDSRAHELLGATASSPGSPKPNKLKKPKEKPNRKAKRSQAETADSNGDEPGLGISVQRAERRSKRKAQTEDRATPTRSAKKGKTIETVKANHAPLSMRFRTHSATPGPSNNSGRVEINHVSLDHHKGQSTIVSPMKEEPDDDTQMFSSPTTPFKQYKPMIARSGQPVTTPLNGQQPPGGPHHRVQDQHAISACVEQNHAGGTSYSDPGGEKTYQCKYCSVWFKYSQNEEGSCKLWHPGEQPESFCDSCSRCIC